MSLTRPIMADVVMLICDQRDNGGAGDVPSVRPRRELRFYYHDGRQKRASCTWRACRAIEARQRFTSLTDPLMDEARDRLEPIERAVKARGRWTYVKSELEKQHDLIWDIATRVKRYVPGCNRLDSSPA